jgi:enamine deaminase RidA (YjgF/YER057c/UK114 family)
MRMEKRAICGLQVVSLPRRCCRELFITAAPAPGEPAGALLGNIAGVLRDCGGRIVSQEVFGIWSQEKDVRRALASAFGEIAWPVTWVRRKAAPTACLGGIQTWAVSGVSVEPLEFGGHIVGSTFEDDDARYCRLGGLLPTDATSSRAAQAREVLEQMETVLRAAGMEFRQVLRTWFYNADILSWYGDFNQTRNSFFTEQRVFDAVVPASTAVGTYPAAALATPALVSGLLAVRAKSGKVVAVAVPSALQRAALDYGSSFSRAVELTLPDHRRLLVSGTASIAAGGHTVYAGDVDAQIARTLEVVHAILASRGMDWPDVTRAIAHFKRAADVAVFHGPGAGCPAVALPVLSVESEICRDDLLFELEVDAVGFTEAGGALPGLHTSRAPCT